MFDLPSRIELLNYLSSMNNPHPNQDLDLTVPYFSTWGAKGQKSATWYINPPFQFQSSNSSKVNAWFLEKTHRTLDAFSHFARAWGIGAQSSPLEPESEFLWQCYEKGISYQKFLDKTLSQISRFEKPIYQINVKFDLFVCVYTSKKQESLKQGWVRHLAAFRCQGNLEDEWSVCEFNLYLSLFQAFVSEYGNGDNQQLHFLNQPLLYEALCKWEQSVGEIVEFEGSPGCYRYGFSLDPADYGR